MTRSRDISRFVPWLTLAVLCVGCFAFFQWLYPYHLHHREQTMMYEGMGAIGSFGFLGRWLSSWLTQYFYYRVAGPTIVTAVMALVWLGAWLVVRNIWHNRLIACISASLIMLWQTLCQTSHLATLQPPLALAALLIVLGLCLSFHHSTLNTQHSPLTTRYSLLLLSAAATIWLMGNPFGGRLWAWPDMAVERRFALDSEAYFGNWDRVLALAADNTTNKTEVYYYNLANAINGTLPDNLLKHKQIGTEGLMPVLGTNSDYLAMNSLGELWYRVGALTDAEHCAMLGLVFSPNSTGSRYLKRLAEVNLALGEDAAAMKYLRILADSPVHGTWARQHTPGQQTEAVQAEIAALRAMQPQTDSLHLANDIVLTLRHMLRCGDALPGGDALASPGASSGALDQFPGDAKASPPTNRMAYDYLLCLHLLNKNLDGFLADFDPAMPRPTIYDEALVIALLHSGADADQAMTYNINPDVLNRFRDFRANPDSPDHATTYWHYYLH